MGPPGDCPCIRQSRGQKVYVSETSIAKELWDHLTDEEKTTINGLKQEAFFRWFVAKNKADAPQA